MTVKARSVPPAADWSTHPGEEYVLVLSGAVELHTEHYAPVRLGAGDSAYFDSLMKHCYVAASEEPPRLISISLSGSSDLGASVGIIKRKNGRE
jgi:quercetin dioxygenase-like cupin family protein